MRILSRQEWDHLYRTEWRPRIAHLTKKQRSWYVRQCVGKTGFVSRAEAYPQMISLPVREGTALGVYRCKLCGGWFHIGNSVRRFEWRKERAKAQSPGPSSNGSN
jgi:hypothetical protein